MKSTIFLACLAAGALGCFGSDPNMNSMYVGDAGPTTTGTGGSGPGTGGSGMATGGVKGTGVALFATGGEGFQLNTYHDTTQKNLGDPASNANPTLSWDSGDGNPDPGSLKVVVTYSGSSQYVDVQSKSMMATPQNWAGKTLHVRIKADTGNFGGGAQPYVLTGNYVFGGTHTNFQKNANWQEFTVNLDLPVTKNDGYDATQVIVFGVQLTSDTTGVTGDVTFHIDSFSVDPPIAGSTGTGGAGGSGDASAGN